MWMIGPSLTGIGLCQFIQNIQKHTVTQLCHLVRCMHHCCLGHVQLLSVVPSCKP